MFSFFYLDDCVRKNRLCAVVKTVHAGAVALGDQFRLGGQPMLHLVALARTLVHISEVGPPGHLVRRGRKIDFVLAQIRRSRSRGEGGILILVLILRGLILFHGSE